MIRVAGALALLLPLAAATDDPLAGRTAGEPRQCIDARSSGPTIIDQHTILYDMGRRTVYRTEIEGCPALRPLTTLVVDVWGTQLCRNDRFRVVEPNSIIPSAPCRFGVFVPYTKVKARSD